MAGLRPFSELTCISKHTLEVIDSLGFKTATPVQEATIPLFCGNKDVAVDASTGSGKTLAFVVPVIEKLRRLDEKLKPHQVRPAAV
jgi:ATP-dependent RNA helicase DDX55/SPB4